MFNLLVRLATGLPFWDTQCGFKAFRMSVCRPLIEVAQIDRFGFDVELLFLYPWAVAQYSVDAPSASAVANAAASAPFAPGIPREFRGLVFGEILVFIVVLAAAFAYAWRKGVFEWR